MKHEPATRTHAEDEEAALVIHHPEQDDTLLAHWLRRAMARGASFWAMVAGLVALIVLLAYLAGGQFSGESASAKAWGRVMLATSPDDLQNVADTAEATEAGGYAGLMAATARYREALGNLPNDRTAATPLLARALEGYRTVQENAQADDTLKRLAMIGIARTYETRDELAEAITAYQNVAKTWPETQDGKNAAARAKLLQEPTAVAFYKAFSEYKPKSAAGTLGPRGANAIGLPEGHPDLDGAVMPAPSLTGGVPAGSVPTPKGELPGDVFQKDKPDTSKTNPVLPDVFGTDPFKKDDAPRSGAELPK